MRQQIRDWLSIGISVGSLFISILSFAVSASVSYYNVFRQNDDVRVAIGIGPWFRHDTKSDKLFVDNKASLTFINSGTRSAAVTHISLEVAKSKKKISSEACREWPGSGVYYKFEPFVIKASEVLVKEISLDYSDGGLTFITNPVDVSTNPYYASVCMMMVLVTPDSSERVAHVPIGVLEVHKSGREAGYTTRPKDYGKPFPLLPGHPIQYRLSDK